MSSLKNRGASRLAMLAAAALLAFAQPAAAQEPAADHPEWAEVTKTLPTRYAGTTLTILMDPGSAWTNYIEASKEFEDATGITLAPTELQFGDHQQKSYLDALSKTGSFDLNHIVYMWKRNLAPALADVEELAEQVPDAPPLHLDDYIPEVLEIYGRVDGKLIGLPSLGDVTSFIWNKDHYAEAGLDPEQDRARGKNSTRSARLFSMPGPLRPLHAGRTQRTEFERLDSALPRLRRSSISTPI